MEVIFCRILVQRHAFQIKEAGWKNPGRGRGLVNLDIGCVSIAGIYKGEAGHAALYFSSLKIVELNMLWSSATGCSPRALAQQKRFRTAQDEVSDNDSHWQCRGLCVPNCSLAQKILQRLSKAPAERRGRDRIILQRSGEERKRSLCAEKIYSEGRSEGTQLSKSAGKATSYSQTQAMAISSSCLQGW